MQAWLILRNPASGRKFPTLAAEVDALGAYLHQLLKIHRALIVVALVIERPSDLLVHAIDNSRQQPLNTMSTSSEPKIQEPEHSVQSAGIVPSDTAQNPSIVESDEGGKPLDTGVNTAADDKGVKSEQKEIDDDEDDDEDEDDEDEEDEDAEPKVSGDDAVVYPRRFLPKGRPNKVTSGTSSKP